jgi:hypothetical protein
MELTAFLCSSLQFPSKKIFLELLDSIGEGFVNSLCTL